jgi:hypothetical protein
MKKMKTNTKTSKSIKNSLNNLLKALGENVAEEIPEGWLTIEQIAKESDKSVWWARNTMKKLLEHKLVETKKMRISTGNGNCLVRIYKI